jgi:hypothetical protein
MRKTPVSCIRCFSITALAMAVAFTMTQPQTGWALLVPAFLSAKADPARMTREQDLQSVQRTLESKVLRQRLAEFGLSPQDINQRVTQLSDSQLHQLVMRVRTLNPGADDGGDVVITVLVIGILVLLFVYLWKRLGLGR